MTPEEHELNAYRSLEAASKWRRESNVGSEQFCLRSAVDSFLGVAVTRFADSTNAIEYLRSRQLGTIIQRSAILNNQLYQSYISFLEKTSPAAAGVDTDVTAVQIAWLVDEWESANILLRICADARVTKSFPLTKVWAEYCRALQHLAVRKAYEPALPKLRGYEKCWAPYVHLISNLTQGRDVSDARGEIGRMFAKRNSDKRLTGRMIDGDGHHPVKWDFRESSILKCWEFAPFAPS